MTTYLLHHEGKARIIKIDAAATSADDYGKIQEWFLADAVKRERQKFEWTDMVKLECDQKIGNIYYDEDLAGSAGMSFRLWVLPNIPLSQVDDAKAKLYRDRDVVRMQVVKIKELI
ncbi:unnamed protein product [Sphagnum jensenii]|uniref:Uncharacterized protein n=1 Tax=Sphagnum jensenii TaxID=128206 RepID=A0ABP0V9Y5_9BRYO